MSSLRFRYQTIEFGHIDIHLRTLRDNQQFSDPEQKAEKLGISSALWPLFGIVWPSSMVMAHFLVDYNYGKKRILEVGCGIGLASLLLNYLTADITATDYHPEVEGFLEQNAFLNHGKKIPFVRTDWKDENVDLGCFDLVIGSDLLYENEHADLLSRFIQYHANQACDVIIVDPGRGHLRRFSQLMENSGFTSQQSRPVNTDYLVKPFAGKILQYHRT